MDIRKLKNCVCRVRQKRPKNKGKVIHEYECLENQLKVHEMRLDKAKSNLRKEKNKKNMRNFRTAYTSWWNCKQLLKDPELFSKMYQKRNEEMEKTKPIPVFKDCFCIDRKRVRMPHEKECLEKRKSILWERVEQAKEKNDLKERDKAYTVYYTNERKLKWYEKTK